MKFIFLTHENNFKWVRVLHTMAPGPSEMRELEADHKASSPGEATRVTARTPGNVTPSPPHSPASEPCAKPGASAQRKPPTKQRSQVSVLLGAVTLLF